MSDRCPRPGQPLGKLISIHQHIGRRPMIAAFGNSNGDFEMLKWITFDKGTRLGLIVHHTAADREWANNRDSHMGRLSKALDETPKCGRVVMDMKRDWKLLRAIAFLKLRRM